MSILQPTYYTRHPDETYSVADPQPTIQPVKQELVAFVSDVHLGRYTLEWNGQPLPEGTQLYAAPVSVEAIRAEALEEAAKRFEGGDVGNVIAIAIRNLK